MINKNFSNDYHMSFPNVVTRQKLTNSPTIGFEWEVPVNWKDLMGKKSWNFDRTYDESIENFRNAWNKVDDVEGYYKHFNGGGYEFSSPIFPTISTARSHAKWLIQKIKKHPELFVDKQVKGFHDGGIHIHISPKQNHSLLFEIIYDVLNRGSTKDFLFKFSGRSVKINGYHKNAVANGWDTRKYPDYQGGMLKCNNLNTLEFRLFGNSSDRLIPALEFTHSLVKYLTRPSVFNLNKGRLSLRQRTEVRPTLYGWKDWLMKQDGYKTLKSDPALKLLERNN